MREGEGNVIFAVDVATSATNVKSLRRIGPGQPIFERVTTLLGT
jgi:hypothetical protein